MAQFFEFTDDGIVFKGFQDVRKALKESWNTTFGVDLDYSPTSPDGHHIDLEAKTINSVMEAVQTVATMMNRNQASGVFLDYLAALLGLTRNENESDDELRTRMNSASITGYATYDGMFTYLQDYLTGVGLSVNDEPDEDDDGIPGHSFRVVVPESVIAALDEKVEKGEIESTANYIAQLIWNCKPAGIKADGNSNGVATDSAGLTHTIRYSIPESIEIDIKIVLSLYSEESFPSNGIYAVEEAIQTWASTAFTPGKDVIPERFYTPIMTVPGIASATFSLKKTSSSTWQSSTISISSQQTAVLKSISVQVGF